METLVVIGSGFSAVCFLENLVRKKKLSKYQIILFEKFIDQLGTGIPYQNCYNRSDKLNVKINQLGINSDHEDGFYQWMLVNGKNVAPDEFVERKYYGEYLRFVLSQFKKNINIIFEEVIKIDQDYIYSRNNQIKYDKVLVLTGMNPNQNVNIHNFLGKDNIKIKGSGLSAIDQVIELKKQGYSGVINLFSRRGILPLAHSSSTLEVEELPNNLLPLIHFVRKNPDASLGVIRKNINTIWSNLTNKERMQFLKYVKPYWEYFRHRTLAEHLDKINQMKLEGQLVIHKIKNNVVVEYDLDCSGLNPFNNTLITKMIEDEILIIDNLNLGVNLNSKFREKVFLSPSLQRHLHFEMTAVRELRSEMEKLALSF